MFHAIDASPSNRRKLNQRIRELAVEFIGLTNLSSRQGGSHAMYAFVVHVFQLGLSFPRDHLEALIDAGDLIDPITPKAISEELAANAEKKFRASLDELVDVKFVNIVVDAGMVHQLKTIVCLLSSPHVSAQPVLLDLRENRSMSKQKYAELFGELVAQAENTNLIVCSVIIDNLMAQSAGLDSFLDSANSPVIHVKCFAHMSNLIISNTLEEPNLRRVMERLTAIQGLLRTREAARYIGKKCPAFVRTRWFYMIDTLAFIFDNLDQIRGYMFASEVAFPLDHVPTEIFELYAILLPFACFLRAVESRSCNLCSIVPLARRLLAALSDVQGLLQTGAAMMILRDMHIRLLARLCVNNRAEALTAYALTLQGREELRAKEADFSTQGRDSEIDLTLIEDNQGLKSYMKGNRSYDDVMTALFQEMSNAQPFIREDVCAPSVFGQIIGGHRDMDGHNEFDTQNYRSSLSHFAGIPDKERFELDIYADANWEKNLYEVSQNGILQVAEKVAQKLGYDPNLTTIRAMYDRWLFAPRSEIPFLSGTRIELLSANEMWRTAHRYTGWEIFAGIALRFVASGTSEADAERVLSMQRNIAGLHGTRFGIQGMRARMIGRRRFPGSKRILVESHDGTKVAMNTEEEEREEDVARAENDDSDRGMEDD
jgi:hypothetical protein